MKIWAYACVKIKSWKGMLNPHILYIHTNIVHNIKKFYHKFKKGHFQSLHSLCWRGIVLSEIYTYLCEDTSNQWLITNIVKESSKLFNFMVSLWTTYDIMCTLKGDIYIIL